MLRLMLPNRRCCAFRQAMMADPATMACNALWFPPDGTIPFPEASWEAFLGRWQETDAFPGFPENEEGMLVGEVNRHDMGRGGALSSRRNTGATAGRA